MIFIFALLGLCCVIPVCIFESSLKISQTAPKVKIFVGADNFDNAG